MNINKSQVQGSLFSVSEVDEQNKPVMGILNDGTPYLTMYGLAKLCGVEASALWAFTSKWNPEDGKPRTDYIADILYKQGYDIKTLFTRVTSNKGQETHAYPDYVCMAVLEYYALEAKRFDNSIARDNYRRLASYTLRKMIYDQLGVKSSQDVISKSWQVYQERILLNDQIPVDYFSIFREMADLLVRLINSQFNLDPYSIPDISVGIHWGKYWECNNFCDIYGERIKHPHYYPQSFPQSKAGAIPAWIYPIGALGEFRKWLMTTYIRDKLAPYLETKVQQKIIPANEKEQILLAIEAKNFLNRH
ncbi:hypothetical protein [Orbus mooreae]|uniref:hypothetical protein n=1 Tax=Orbus mooreae TaxID=3074107 RepID=UPI00370D72F5